MRTTKTSKIFLIPAAILSCLVFLTVSCSKQSASILPEQTVKASESENSFSADPKIKAAREFVDKSPDSPVGYNRLAVAYIRAARESGDFRLNSSALAAVEKALRLSPEDANAQKLNASLHLTFHRFPEALEAGGKLRQKYPQDPFVYGVLTDANVELGNYNEAVETVQKMVDLKPSMESFARVSRVRSLHGDTKGAIQAMLMAANIADPADKEARAWCFVYLGHEYFKAGRYKEAETSYDIALKGFPEYHYALAGKGLARMANNDYENAIKYLEQAQNRIPLTETVIALGDLYKKTGNVEKANKQYELVEAIEQKLNPTFDQRRLALFWADHDIKLDEALEIAARIHNIQKDVLTEDIYAWCLYKKGRFEEAKAAMQSALRIKEKEARTFYHAGMIEKALGNKKEAVRLLREALQINPAFDLLQADNAKAALRELNSL